MQSVVGFFRNVVSEMKKVSWPKKKELTRYTITVLVTVTLVSLYFAVVDVGISSIIDLILE